MELEVLKALVPEVPEVQDVLVGEAALAPEVFEVWMLEVWELEVWELEVWQLWMLELW